MRKLALTVAMCLMACPSFSQEIETISLNDYINQLRDVIYSALQSPSVVDRPLQVEKFTVDVNIVHLSSNDGLETLVLLSGDGNNLAKQKLTLPISLGSPVLIGGQEFKKSTDFWSSSDLLNSTLHDTLGQPAATIVQLQIGEAIVIAERQDGSQFSFSLSGLNKASDGRLMAPIFTAGKDKD